MGKKIGHLEKKGYLEKIVNLEFFFLKCYKNLEILEYFGKNLEILKYFGKNLEILKQFGKNLKILENFGNLENKIGNLRKEIGNLKKNPRNLEKFVNWEKIRTLENNFEI